MESFEAKVKDWHLLGTIPDVCIIQNGREEEVEDHHNCKSITCYVKWSDQWTSSVI